MRCECAGGGEEPPGRRGRRGGLAKSKRERNELASTNCSADRRRAKRTEIQTASRAGCQSEGKNEERHEEHHNEARLAGPTARERKEKEDRRRRKPVSRHGLQRRLRQSRVPFRPPRGPMQGIQGGAPRRAPCAPLEKRSHPGAAARRQRAQGLGGRDKITNSLVLKRTGTLGSFNLL